MLVIAIVAMVTRKVSHMLKFKQSCMHGFEFDINDRTLGQLFPCPKDYM